MSMQLIQCFSRAKPLTKKWPDFGFFDFQKQPKVFKKASQNCKIWLQKSQIGNPGSRHYKTDTCESHKITNIAKIAKARLLRQDH